MNSHPSNTDAIRNLQTYLRQLSYEEPTIPPPPIDGIFDIQTENALREYQTLRGLPPTGRGDEATWNALYRDYRASLARNFQPRTVHIFPPTPYNDRIRKGRQDFTVTVLQHMLRELERHYSDLDEVTLNGIYDDPTIRAVRLFQEKNRLPIGDEVDLLTWNAIADLYNTLHLRQEEE